MINCDKALEMALSKSTDIYVRCDILLIGSIADISDLIDRGFINTGVDRPVFRQSVLTDDIMTDWTDLWDEYPDFS